MVHNTWERDLQVLETIADLEGLRGAELHMVAAQLAIPKTEAAAALQRLGSGGLVTYKDSSSMADWDAMGIRLTGEARRRVGQWPSEDVAYEELLQLLEQRAGAEPDPDRRQALERARSFLEAAGASAVGGVLHSLWRILAGM